MLNIWTRRQEDFSYARSRMWRDQNVQYRAVYITMPCADVIDSAVRVFEWKFVILNGSRFRAAYSYS
jgi:hypothetical protein